MATHGCCASIDAAAEANWPCGKYFNSALGVVNEIQVSATWLAGNPGDTWLGITVSVDMCVANRFYTRVLVKPGDNALICFSY